MPMLKIRKPVIGWAGEFPQTYKCVMTLTHIDGQDALRSDMGGWLKTGHGARRMLWQLSSQGLLTGPAPAGMGGGMMSRTRMLTALDGAGNPFKPWWMMPLGHKSRAWALEARHPLAEVVAWVNPRTGEAITPEGLESLRVGKLPSARDVLAGRAGARVTLRRIGRPPRAG